MKVTMRVGNKGISIVLALVGILIASVASADMAIPVPLDTLLSLSDKIFYGKVIDKGLDIGDCGHVVTDVTFQVTTPIKGNITVGDTVLVTRFGVDGKEVSDEFKAQASKIHGPSWAQGKSYLVFLGPEGECGYNNTVGIGSGLFSEGKDAAGKPTLMNAAQNLKLFGGSGLGKFANKLSLNPAESKVLQTTRGPVDRDTFLTLLPKMVQAQSSGN